LPTGAGKARALTSDNIAHVLGAFHPDGKRFLFSGYEAGKPPRIWIQDLAGGKAKALTPEGISSALMSGPNLIVRKADGLRVMVPLDGGPEQPIKFLAPTDAVIRFTNDGRAAYLRVRTTTPGVVQVVKIDLTSGARTTLHTITAIREALPSGGVGPAPSQRGRKVVRVRLRVDAVELFVIKGLK
jgi:Tol biopolymer transport system component